MIDITEHIGAMSRHVSAGERDGRATREVVAQRTYPAPVDDVWEAVTDPERIPRWFLPVSGDLRVGGRYQLEGNAGGEVLACEAPHRLSITWEYGEEVTWVDVVLVAADGPAADGAGTTLTLRHCAFDDPQRWEQYGPGAVGVGWELGLVGLALHLASGAPVDAAAVAAWSASDDGRAFMTASSAGWGDAAVAAGDDDAAARAAQARTTAFYTGVPEEASAG